MVAGMTLGEGAITLDELVAEDHENLALVFGTEGDGLKPTTDSVLGKEGHHPNEEIKVCVTTPANPARQLTGLVRLGLLHDRLAQWHPWGWEDHDKCPGSAIASQRAHLRR